MNVQNIPRDDKVVKAAFMPKHDLLLFFDYPNIELKMLAWYMEKIGHPAMADVFREGADLHRRTAAGLFGVPEGQVTDAQRQTAKRVNFSIVYGGGIPTLIEQGVCKDAKEALNLLKRYHGTWPGIGWQTRRSPAKVGTLAWKLDQRISTRGYITTLWGRHLRPHSEHVRINCLCQGCSADLIKYSMVRVHRFCAENGLRSHLVNSVHDEICLDTVTEELPILLREVPRLMDYEPIGSVVPIRPEPEISYTTWADKAPYMEEALAA
jgi:DNA polymerase-1